MQGTGAWQPRYPVFSHLKTGVFDLAGTPDHPGNDRPSNRV
jgi:hypothetical protein